MLRHGTIAIENVAEKSEFVVNRAAYDRSGEAFVTVHHVRVHCLQVSGNTQLNGLRPVLSESPEFFVVVAQFDHMKIHQHSSHQQRSMFRILMQHKNFLVQR